VVVNDQLSAAQTSYTSEQLPPGAYWVHVSGIDTGCVPPCVETFSDAAQVTIPAAEPPKFDSVSQIARQPTATWSLDPALKNDYIEIATSPDTYPEGDFLSENVVLKDLLDPDVTTWTAEDQLPAGVYYVHLVAYDPSCPFTCPETFSDVMPLGIPPDPEVHPAAAPFVPKPKPDIATDFSVIKGAATQKAGNLVIRASMLEAGTITAGGTLSIPSAAKVYKLKAVAVSVTAYELAKITVKLPRKALRAARRALKRRRTVRAHLTLTARDAAGNIKTQKRSIKLKR